MMATNHQGFTLLEVMMAIAIMAVLAAIALPNYLAYRERAFYANCLATRENLELEAKAYLSAHGVPDPGILEHGHCPQSGVFVWQTTDPEAPFFGKVLCSLHSESSAPAVPAETPAESPVETPAETPAETSNAFEVPTGENVIQNSGFETLKNPPKSGKSKKFAAVDGWSSDGQIKVWAGDTNGTEAPEGDYYIELDANKNKNKVDRIFQEVETEEGRVYEIQFSAQAVQTGSSDFLVSWGGETIDTISPENGTWNLYSLKVVGTGAPMELSISEVSGQSDGKGVLLDSIQVITTGEAI